MGIMVLYSKYIQSMGTLNYGKYGVFLILGKAGFVSSTV